YRLSATFPQLSTDAPRSRFAADRRACACPAAVIRGRGHVDYAAIAVAHQAFAVGVPLGQLPRCSAAVESDSIVGQDKTAAYGGSGHPCHAFDLASILENVWRDSVRRGRQLRQARAPPAWTGDSTIYKPFCYPKTGN